MSNIKQNLQTPFQPWAPAHDFLGVCLKSFHSGHKHLSGFVTSVPSIVVSSISLWLTCMHVCWDVSFAQLDHPPAWLGQSLSESHRALCCLGQSGNEWQFPRCASRHEQIGKNKPRVCSLPLPSLK